MAVEVRVPVVGESILEGTVGRWLVEDGAAVKEGDTLFELETDKASAEIVAPAAGILRRLVTEGDLVKVGAVVAQIDPNGAAKPAAKMPPPPPKSILPPVPMPRAVATVAAPAAFVPPPEPVELPESTAERPLRRERMTRLRKTIAERMLAAQRTAAILSTFNEADLSRMMALRSRHKDLFKETHGVNLGFMSFFARACALAIKAVPQVNAAIVGEEIVYYDYCDFGIAVGGDKGLIVPVVRNIERMTFAQVEGEIARLAARARAGKIELDELKGGTFTISNVGVYGPLFGTPIINPPQTAILGMYAIKNRCVPDENNQPAVRPMMYLALSYDHRLLDGKDAATFLVRVKELVENPERLLLDV